MPNPVIVRQLGLADYKETLAAMLEFNASRSSATPDEIWLLEHPAVFTLGINADEKHIIDAGNIPIVRTDRGGQVTYHGPGQLVAYVLLDLTRARLGVRKLVRRLEQAVVTTLASYAIAATGRDGAPGVYVNDAKIASVGLRIRRNCCYHGISINVATDPAAFARINPCGYEGMAVTCTAELGGPDALASVAADLLPNLLEQLRLTQTAA
jgi:lipoyl(octanoyl) transferase